MSSARIDNNFFLDSRIILLLDTHRCEYEIEQNIQRVKKYDLSSEMIRRNKQLYPYFTEFEINHNSYSLLCFEAFKTLVSFLYHVRATKCTECGQGHIPCFILKCDNAMNRA